MSEPTNCGRCHLAGVPQVMPSGAIVTDDFCGGCPLAGVARLEPEDAVFAPFVEMTIDQSGTLALADGVVLVCLPPWGHGRAWWEVKGDE